MRKSRFSEQQIAFALRQAEACTPVTEVCRKMGGRLGAHLLRSRPSTWWKFEVGLG